MHFSHKYDESTESGNRTGNRALTRLCPKDEGLKMNITKIRSEVPKPLQSYSVLFLYRMNRLRSSRSSSICLLIAFLLLCSTAVAARKRKAAVDAEAEDDDDIPDVPFLVETIGKEIYAAVNCRKYKFYIYMTVGKLPDEKSTIILINMVCNLLYALSILLGFLFLPRGYMLVGTAVTLFVGPALILILLGTVALMLVAFAIYPVISVFSMWVLFFLTSHLAQVLGRRLGLDHDGDGDVDMLDVLSYAASTKWGQWIGLPKLHKMLNESSMDPFQEINRRLDEIQDSTQALGNGRRSTKMD